VFDKDLKEKQLRLVCKKYLEFESKNAKNEKEIEQAKARVNAVIQDKMSKINNTTNDGVDNNDNEE
jgi:N-glycosylase/DNA lyase